MRRTFGHRALFVCLVMTVSQATNDPFVGDWKLNVSKSTLTDRMKVESVGGNKYAFDFGGGSETIVVDGTDQPTQLYGGGTLSVAVEGDLEGRSQDEWPHDTLGDLEAFQERRHTDGSLYWLQRRRLALHLELCI